MSGIRVWLGCGAVACGERSAPKGGIPPQNSHPGHTQKGPTGGWLWLGAVGVGRWRRLRRWDPICPCAASQLHPCIPLGSRRAFGVHPIHGQDLKGGGGGGEAESGSSRDTPRDAGLSPAGVTSQCHKPQSRLHAQRPFPAPRRFQRRLQVWDPARRGWLGWGRGGDTR